jgi:protein subunit release factor B
MKKPNYADFGNVTDAKIKELFTEIDSLHIDFNQIEEKFIKGSGKGGQKINKTNNAVMLIYKPLKIIIKCQRERSRAVNRFIALRTLVEKIKGKQDNNFGL